MSAPQTSPEELFSQLCQTPTPLTEPSIRKIVLLQTHGLVPALHLVRPEDGSPWKTRDLCDRTRRYVVKSQRKKDLDLDTRVQALMRKEAAVVRLRPLSKSKEALLDILVKYNSRTFRRDLLASKVFDVRGIHLFRWDGTCRSVEDVRKALRLYSSANKARMTKIVVGVLGGVLGIGAVAGAVVLSRRGKGAKAPEAPDQEEASQAPDDESSCATIFSTETRGIWGPQETTTHTFNTPEDLQSYLTTLAPSIKGKFRTVILDDPSIKDNNFKCLRIVDTMVQIYNHYNIKYTANVGQEKAHQAFTDIIVQPLIEEMENPGWWATISTPFRWFLRSP